MVFIQKRRKMLPNRDRRFKDENLIFSTSINMYQKLREVLTFLTLKMVKNDQNCDFLPITGSHGQFFKLKIQSAQFLNRINSLLAKHKKKTKKCVGCTAARSKKL
jgi:hypothetical protein